MGRNVFVSFAVEDRPLVESVLEQLGRRQIISPDDNVLIDYDPGALGSTFRDSAREALTDADTVVVIWSRAAALSNWVNYELGMADALGKRLITVLLKDASPELPSNLQQTESVELAIPSRKAPGAFTRG